MMNWGASLPRYDSRSFLSSLLLNLYSLCVYNFTLWSGETGRDAPKNPFYKLLWGHKVLRCWARSASVLAIDEPITSWPACHSLTHDLILGSHWFQWSFMKSCRYRVPGILRLFWEGWNTPLFHKIFHNILMFFQIFFKLSVTNAK